MAADTRNELERVLLAEAVDRGSFAFLEKENVTPDHFEANKELATRLWGEQALPSRRQVKDWEEFTIADWTPDPDGVAHAIEGVKKFRAQDQVHRELYSMRNILSEDRVNGWKTIMEEVPSRLNAIRDNFEAGKAPDDNLLPWLDIEEAFKSGIGETEHLIRGVVLAGQSHVLFAPGDSGKSWIAMWITKEAIERGLTVIYFDFENTPGKFLQRMNILGASREDMARFIKYTYAPQLTLEPEPTRRFAKVLDAVKPDLIVWDSWMGPLGVCQIKENDNDDIRYWATKYVDPAKDRGIATVILDHTGHENTDRNRGASRKFDEMDVVWKIKKKQSFNTSAQGEIILLNKKDRFFSLPEKVTFEIGGTPFRCEPSILDDLDVDLNENARKLRRFVEKHPEGVTWSQIVQLFGGSTGSASRAVKELRAHGLLEQDEQTKVYRGTPKQALETEKNPLGFQGSNGVPGSSEPEGNGQGSTRGGVCTPPMEPHAEKDGDLLGVEEHELLGNKRKNTSQVVEDEETLEDQKDDPTSNASMANGDQRPNPGLLEIVRACKDLFEREPKWIPDDVHDDEALFRHALGLSWASPLFDKGFLDQDMIFEALKSIFRKRSGSRSTASIAEE